MKWHRSLALSVVISVLLTGVGFFALGEAWVDRRSALASVQFRLSELRAQRLDPRDVETIKRVLAAAPDPQAGLLVARDGDAVSRLETYIRSVAQNHNAEVLAISAAEGMAEGKLSVVRGSLHLVVRDEDFGSLVKSLETGNPAIFVERLRAAYKLGTNADNEPPMLDLMASILVYRETQVAEGAMP
ncbi:GspMb/PilO family protein [Microvirga flavescens]|uniref:GspMb/PilO family protein n=1 Tax=Microvirga flavescens TaxID=2249811 RepID=UPI000DD65DE5|nr:hypothetical protein [Microvirga flavescens]